MTRSTTIPILLLILIITAQSTLLLKYPPVWPDETIYANIASNWLEGKRLAPTLWGNAYLGATEHFYSYPPIFLIAVALVIKLFSVSILAQRLIPFLASILFLLTFYHITKSSFTNKKIRPLMFLPLIGLSIDPFFSLAARISRPEMFVGLLGFISFFAFLKSQTAQNRRTSRLLIVSSGFFSSVAFLTHFLGGIIFAATILTSLLIYEKYNFLKSPKVYLFLGSLIFIPAIWFISIAPNFEVFQKQLFLYKRAFEDYSSFISELALGSFFFQIVLFAYVVISVIFILKAFINKEEKLKPLALLLLFSWSAALYSKEIWHFFYVIPWVYLAAFHLMNEPSPKHRKFHTQLSSLEIATGLLIILVFAGIIFNSILIAKFWGSKYSYQLFVDEILNKIPQEKTVFISSIPDPYFGFKSEKRKNTIYEFPVVEIESEKFLKILDNSDYIVINGIHNKKAELLTGYIARNTKDSRSVGGRNQYHATIIELLPKNKRENP